MGRGLCWRREARTRPTRREGYPFSPVHTRVGCGLVADTRGAGRSSATPRSPRDETASGSHVKSPTTSRRLDRAPGVIAFLRRVSAGRVRRDASVTVSTAFYGQAAVLVSGVIAARILGVEARGQLALLWIVALVLTQVGLLGLPLAVTYWIARQPASARAIVRLLVCPAVLQAVMLVGTQAVVLYLVMGGEERAVRVAGLYTLGVIPALLAHQYARALLQGQRRFLAFNIVRTLPGSFYTVAIVILFVSSDGDLPTVALVWTSAYIVGAVVSLGYALCGLPSDADVPHDAPSRIEMIRFGLTAMLGSASPLDTFQLDQAVVGFFISPVALGLYVVAVAFTNLPRFVAQSVGFVAFPYVAARSDVSAARRTMWRFAGLALLACGVMVAALEGLADQLVPLFFGPEFSASTAILRILLVSALLAGLRRVLADGARGAGRPGLGTLAEVVSWASLLLVLPFLASTAGVEGVALALVISSGIGLSVLVGTLAVTGRNAPPRRITPMEEGAPVV